MGRDLNDVAVGGGADAVRLAVENGRRIPRKSEREAVADTHEGYAELMMQPVHGMALPDADSSVSRRLFGFTRLGEMPPIQPTNWLIKPFLEANSLAVLFGDPAVGKSFVAIDMACAIATGRPWHGRRAKPGAVFYIAGEGLNSIRKRFCAWEIHHGVDLSQAPLFVSNHAAELYSLDEADKVSATIQRLAESSGVTPALIVIDTLARNFGGDENSTQDMSAFITAVDGALKHKFGACVLIVHHTGHGDKSRARGSIALKAGIDAEYLVTRDDTQIVQLEALKMKDASLPSPMAFASHVVELGLTDEDGEPVTSIALQSADYVAQPVSRKRFGEIEGAVVEFLRSHKVGIRKAEVVAHFKGRYEKGPIYRAIKSLAAAAAVHEAAGMVCISGGVQ